MTMTKGEEIASMYFSRHHHEGRLSVAIDAAIAEARREQMREDAGLVAGPYYHEHGDKLAALLRAAFEARKP